MRGNCWKCGKQELLRKPTEFFRLGLPWLNNLAQVEVPYKCPNCGNEVTRHIRNSHDSHPRTSLRLDGKSGAVDSKSISWFGMPALTMTGVVRQQDRVFIPNSEGRLQDGSGVDQFGNPDLMAEMAAEYLRQFWTLLPDARLPDTLRELMPALLLLVTSAELVLKAFGVRAERPSRGHSLTELYDGLGLDYKTETEHFFRQSVIVEALLENGQDAPNIEHILSIYSNTYDQVGGVYIDARYFAEPTTMLPKSSNLYGANLIKSLVYPVFLPAIVKALLDTYKTTAGIERLRRRGADIHGKVKDKGTGSHGEWGLVPASLGLVAVAVPQSLVIDSKGQETGEFSGYLASNPSALQGQLDAWWK